MIKKLLLASALFLLIQINSKTQAQVIFTEGFSSGVLPTDWTNDSLGLPAANLWLFNNPYARLVTGAGFDANYAIFDSDESLSNDSILELASLTTPIIDISSVTATLFLELDEQFRYLAPPTGEAKRHIEYSADSGMTWNTIVYDSLNYGYPTAVHSIYNISAIVGVNTSVIIRFTWTGDYDWWWAIDNVKIIQYGTCTAPPVPGTAMSSLAAVCPNDLFDLSVMGADSTPDLTYQWQSSPDGTTWTDITGATSTTLTLSQAAATYYQLLVICTGIDSASASVQVTMNPGTSCYCIPPGTSCSGFTGNITNVNITGTTLNQNSGCDEFTDVGYTFWPDVPSSSTNLTRGNTYDFNVTTDDDNIISIWIDFDMNGGFEPNEWTQVATTTVASISNTSSILIPGTAAQGATRMRVRARLVGNQNDSSSACLSFGSGESEDYVIGLDFAVGVNKIALKGTSLYPNPATGVTSIFFENTISSASIFVTDLTGRVVLSKEISNVFSTQLNLSNESNGIYFVRILTQAGESTHKLILSK